MNDATRPDLVDRIAAAILALEAVLLLAVGVVYAVYAVRGDEVQLAATLGIIAFAVLMAVGIAVVARAFARGARWSRGAALTWQVLQAAAAVVMLGALPWVAATLIVASALVAAASMRASARDARESA